MPRLSHALPKYRKHSASGQAFVELNGHRHYLGPHETKSSKLEYDRPSRALELSYIYLHLGPATEHAATQ